MTKLLEDAFERAAQLPANEQEALASWILTELQADAAWERSFERSHDALGKLADEALAEYQAGATAPLEPLRD